MNALNAVGHRLHGKPIVIIWDRNSEECRIVSLTRHSVDYPLTLHVCTLYTLRTKF